MGSRRLSGWILLVVTLAAYAAVLTKATPSNPEISAITSWLSAHAIRFDTTNPTANLNDLAPLKSMIGDARIIALGEATHGTHEFFQMKHRLLEFLVEEKGFNTFAIEANWPEANLIDDYIHTGQGDPSALLKGLYFWTWDTQEVLDMIQWMRAYNENPDHPSKISFFGFDMQYDQMARTNVVHYVQQADPQAAGQLVENYACYPQLSPDCLQKFQDVYDWLDQHRAALIAQSAPVKFDLALHSARIVIQSVDLAAHPSDFFLRDQYMAENIKWILDQAGPAAKIVLWAHNAHVGIGWEGTSRSMGRYLREQYGTQIVVFGFLFDQGSFNAYGKGKNYPQAFQVGPLPADSVEYYFHAVGLPRFFLDLRSVESGTPAGDWLLSPHPFRLIAAYYDPYKPQVGFQTAALAKVFDVVAYFQDTSPSILMK